MTPTNQGTFIRKAKDLYIETIISFLTYHWRPLANKENETNSSQIGDGCIVRKPYRYYDDDDDLISFQIIIYEKYFAYIYF